jgi:hypothetical protein
MSRSPRAPRLVVGAVLLLVGAAAGLAASQTMVTRSAHQAGACSALNMAAALGYLDAEQQRQVRHARFSGSRPRLQETCNARAGG